MDAALMDKYLSSRLRRTMRGEGSVLKIVSVEMERLRLLALFPDHPHAVFLFTVERAKDKHR